MKSRKQKAAVLLWLSGMMIFLGGCGESSLQGLEEDLAKVVEKAGPSVVCIMAKNESSGEVKFGSGVILDGGYILTTESIFDNVDNITFKLQDGRVINDHEIVGISCDFETNVSLIQVENKELKPIRIMEEGKVENGCLGIALGNTNYSKGLDVSLGTVTKSWIGGADAYDESLMIWHGPVVPYHGGTPIFNRNGELLGLTEGIPEGEGGVVFILPARTCMRVSEVLKKEGKVKRGWIGIFCERKSRGCEKGRTSEGVLITKVAEESPAFKAGLNPGDRIVSFNGKPIESSAQLRKLISATGVGSHVLLSVIHRRDEKRGNVVIKTAEHNGLGMRRCPHRSI
ncbi:MAG: PDZ domain-containing protein [candidate division Zixibacteria bacterium]|nr:PDZ domain-containing protein [candidate division Zixibacteria bacterium]